MLFTELRFLVFFAVVFVVHWTLRSNTARKFFLLVVSYAFYAGWNWRFLGLILASTLVDYAAGRALGRRGLSPGRRRGWMIASLVVNLGILGLFKYYDFFITSAVELTAWLGLPLSARTLSLTLPVGISFYTFQTLSYTLDVYREKLAPVSSLLDFSLFVAFFPQLVAGPIVRASAFLPQLDSGRSFGRVLVRQQLTLFLIGYIKKACVADNLAVAGSALAGGRRGGVVTTAIEHEAVLETTRFLSTLGCPISIVGVDRRGRIDPGDVVAATDGATAVVSVMAANNELGTTQPVAEISQRLRAARPQALLHTDAVQAFVSEPITVASTGADLISLAAHKFGGPKGVGILYVRDGVELEPVIHGGGQELGRRSGTHNVAGIVGMAAAMADAVATRDRFRENVGAARDRFETVLHAAIPGLVVNGDSAHRLVQHSHVRMPGIAAETLLIRLDQAGIAAAAGSACHSGAIEVSHVLAAIGMADDAAGECVRFTFGWGHAAADGELAAKAVITVIEALR